MRFVEMESNTNSNVMMETLLTVMDAQVHAKKNKDGSAVVVHQMHQVFVRNIFLILFNFLQRELLIWEVQLL